LALAPFLDASLACNASFQRVYEVDHFCGSASFRSLNAVSCPFLRNQLAQRLFVVILKFLGTEMP
jgi:hypothetical protein